MRRRAKIVRRTLLPALLLLVLTGIAQDFQLRTRVDLVVVPVTVKAGDRLITQLTKDDFIIRENGRPQAITNFTIDPVPLSAAVLIDTGLSPDSLSKIQQSFTALAGAFSEFDEVAVYRFDKYVAKILDFSGNTYIVEEAMKTLKDIKPDSNFYPSAPARGPFSTPGPVINGAPVVPPGQLGVFVTSPPKNIKVLHDAIFDAATDLKKREPNRRKVVLVISDGTTTGSEHSFDETVQSLLDGGIQVYAIGMDQTPLTRIGSVLSDYAGTTGGDAYFVGSIQNLEHSYATAAETARNQYVLGYVSSNTIRGEDPVFREIQVSVARGAFEVRHRKGYYQYP
jgi:VWFA-related protein